jgi:pimeloyl-ACP methyl ester carboxylesterase
MYVDVGPVHMWYETRGQGDPLLLMHGDLDTNASWGRQLEALGKHFRVFAPERRGQGHTPDVDAPLSYREMADDTVAFVDAVVHEPVHLVGWGGGAVIGLIIALARPDLVRRLVLIGGSADASAYVPRFDEIVRQPADGTAYLPLRAVYSAVSPDGAEHWPMMFSKMTELWRSEPHVPLTELAGVQARTLLVVGDDDLVTLEHTMAMYRTIPDAELAVVPGTSHLAPMEKPDLVNHLLLDFLQLEPVRTLLPVRRMGVSTPTPST